MTEKLSKTGSFKSAVNRKNVLHNAELTSTLEVFTQSCFTNRQLYQNSGKEKKQNYARKQYNYLNCMQRILFNEQCEIRFKKSQCML